VPKKTLTQLSCERLRPPIGGIAVTYFDTNLAGFGLRVSPRGRKTWIAQYRVRGGKERCETIGTMAVIPDVDEARNRARASIDMARRGIDPVKQRDQQEQVVRTNAVTFGKLAEQYMIEYVHRNTKPSTAAQTKRLLSKAESFFADKPVHDICKTDVLQLLAVRKANYQANNLLAVVRRVFGWAVANATVPTDPTFGVSKPVTKLPSCDRVLDDTEIISFWHACGEIGWPFGPLYQLLLLTAQPRGEVGSMQWSELDLKNKVWHIPGQRTKNGKQHDVPLSDLALDVFDGLKRSEPAPGKPDFVFSWNGDAPVTGFAHAKARIAKLMGVDGWRLHDLRRTAAVGMAKLGIPPHVAAQVLNHAPPRGIAAIHHRLQRPQECRLALETWGSYVENLCNAVSKRSSP
jgi:integrase